MQIPTHTQWTSSVHTVTNSGREKIILGSGCCYGNPNRSLLRRWCCWEDCEWASSNPMMPHEAENQTKNQTPLAKHLRPVSTNGSRDQRVRGLTCVCGGGLCCRCDVLGFSSRGFSSSGLGCGYGRSCGGGAGSLCPALPGETQRARE